MSHNVVFEGVKIDDIEALRDAIKELAGQGVNIALSESGTFRTWPGQPDKSDLTIQLGDSNHDVGLIKQPDGTYAPVFDPYGGGVARALGAEAQFCNVQDGGTARNLGKLVQTYAACKAEREAAAMGLSVMRNYDKQSGKIMLTVTGY
jgi:hypothetical protein